MFSQIEQASSSSSSSIEELRAQRLKREREERRKAEQLLSGTSGKTEMQARKCDYDPTRYVYTCFADFWIFLDLEKFLLKHIKLNSGSVKAVSCEPSKLMKAEHFSTLWNDRAEAA